MGGVLTGSKWQTRQFFMREHWGSLHISLWVCSLWVCPISRLMATRDFLVHASSSRKTMWFKTSFPLLKLPFQCVYNLFFFVFFSSSSILIFRVQTRMETNYFFFHGRKKFVKLLFYNFDLCRYTVSKLNCLEFDAIEIRWGARPDYVDYGHFVCKLWWLVCYT